MRRRRNGSFKNRIPGPSGWVMKTHPSSPSSLNFLVIGGTGLIGTPGVAPAGYDHLHVRSAQTRDV